MGFDLGHPGDVLSRHLQGLPRLVPFDHAPKMGHAVLDNDVQQLRIPPLRFQNLLQFGLNNSVVLSLDRPRRSNRRTP